MRPGTAPGRALSLLSEPILACSGATGDSAASAAPLHHHRIPVISTPATRCGMIGNLENTRLPATTTSLRTARFCGTMRIAQKVMGAETPVDRLQLSFLGPPSIVLNQRVVHFDTRKATALLSYLALSGNSVGRDTLVNLLWGRYGRNEGQSALRRTLSTLRKALGAEFIATAGETVLLSELEHIEVDTTRFRQLTAEASRHDHGNSGVCSKCLPLLERAERLYRGDFLTSFSLKDSVDFDDWQFSITDEYRRGFIHVLTKLTACTAAVRDFESALGYARKRLREDPLDESAHRLVMRVYTWSGNRPAALKQYQECQEILKRELEIAPTRQTERLAAAIRSGLFPKLPALQDGTSQRPAHRARMNSRYAYAAALAETIELERFAFCAVVAVEFSHATAKDSDSDAGASDAFREIALASRRFGGTAYHSSRGRTIIVFADKANSEKNLELALRAAPRVRKLLLERSYVPRVAVASGYGNVSSSDDSAGDTPHVTGRVMISALRMVRRQPPDSIVCDEFTHRMSRRTVLYYDSGSIRDESSEEGYYPVVGLHPRTAKTGEYGFAATAFQGRENEFGRLLEALGKAMRGEGQVVVVGGEAGIGKSRLVEELLAHITRLPPNERPLWLEGRSLSRGARLPFWLFVDLLSPYIGGSDTLEMHAPIEAVQRIAGAIAEVVDLEPADIQRIARVINHIAWPDYLEDSEGLESHPEEYRALSLLFRAISDRHPLVLLLDDLQWADPESLELVQTLVGELSDCPTLIVCLHRDEPEGKGARVATLASSIRPGSFAEITLRRLTDADCAEILRTFHPSFPIDEATKRAILELAEGNPLFVSAIASKVTPETEMDFQQMAQSMAKGGTYSLPSAFPGRVRAVLLSGFDELPPPDQRLLSYASAMGREFSKRLLARAAGDGQIDKRLDELCRRQIIFLARTVPEEIFAFRYGLMQVVIYAGLSAHSAAIIHRSIAEALQVPAASKEDLEIAARHRERFRILAITAEHSAPRQRGPGKSGSGSTPSLRKGS